MKRTNIVLTVIAALSAIISSCMGVFFTYGGIQRTVQNIYGQQVVLFGDGIYANDSLMKVGATKGMDITIILAGISILVTIIALRNWKGSRFLRAGLLAIILYASTYLVMGLSLNRLFLLYILQFGSSIFAFVLSLQDIISSNAYEEHVYDRKFTGTGIFTIIGGCSVLMWLTYILPTVINGIPMAKIEIYTTEPTFVIDLGIVLPSSVYCGVMLLRKRKIGYKIAPVLLTLLAGVGICVILQTIFQALLGIVIPVGQLISLVISFIILGAFAAILNVRLLRYARA